MSNLRRNIEAGFRWAGVLWRMKPDDVRGILRDLKMVPLTYFMCKLLDHKFGGIIAEEPGTSKEKEVE